MVALQRISSVINAAFLERLGGGEVAALTSGTAAQLKAASSDAVTKSVTGVSKGTQIFSNAIQSLNSLVSFVNITRQDVSKLQSITTDMIDVVEKATKNGIGQSTRTNLDTKFQELATKFKKVLSTADNRSYDGMQKDDLMAVFQKLGFDKDSSKTFVDLIKEFDFKPNTDNKDIAVTDVSQARRPIRVPQSAYNVTVHTVSNNGDGTFYQTATRTTGSATANYTDIKSGDINGDTLADLVFLGSDGSLSSALGNGDGSFQAIKTYSFRFGDPVTNISVSDLNGDGRADVAGTTLGTDLISTLSNADGSFAAPVVSRLSTLDPVASFTSSRTADVDGDGKADELSVLGNSLYFNKGKGDGSFQVGVATPISSIDESSFTTLDYDNDGKLDVAVTNANGLNILKGNGDGTFSVGQSLADANSISSNLSAVDLNGDGSKDLVAADSSTNQIRIWMNSGGTYSASTALASISGVTSVQTSDINNDGFADIIAVSGINKKILTYLGNGNGTFKAAVTSITGGNPNVAVVQDFNGDGLKELVTGDAVVGGVDNITFEESTSTVVDSIGQKGSTKDYGSLFAAGRNIKSKPDAFKMLADLKALKTQLDTNTKALQDSFNFVYDNMQMLRGVGLAFIDASKELIQRKPNNADAIAAIVEEKVRNAGNKVGQQIGNLNSLSALAITRLGTAASGQSS